MGLQVVLDEVFNHTAQSGQGDEVGARPGRARLLPATQPGGRRRDLDVLPERRDRARGRAEAHGRLGRAWAREYKVDGFRFDLMGHHSQREHARDPRRARRADRSKKDGVDGTAIYLYGEGWNFGEVANNALFVQATQGQLGGTGIGTFNDRLRDAVHGGSPVAGDSTFRAGLRHRARHRPERRSVNGTADQALARPRATRPTSSSSASPATCATTSSPGRTATSRRATSSTTTGSPAGYADQPDEIINYVDAHDNETLYDLSVLKLPADTSMADRVRMNTLSLATDDARRSRRRSGTPAPSCCAPSRSTATATTRATGSTASTGPARSRPSARACRAQADNERQVAAS